MRVRDIVRRSFEHLVHAGTLPPYERQGRYRPPPARFNSTWRPDQLELLHHSASPGQLYEHDDAWKDAVNFVKSFAAGNAASGELHWRADAFCGSFGEVPPKQLLHHVTAVLTGHGLHATGTNSIARVATFEISDNPTVSALPEPFGKWLQIREGQPRWNEPVALRLVVRVAIRIELRRDGGHDAFIDIAMSAPAIALLESIARGLGCTPPVLSGRSWLAKPARSLPISERSIS